MAEEKAEPGDIIKAIDVLCRPHKPAGQMEETSTGGKYITFFHISSILEVQSKNIVGTKYSHKYCGNKVLTFPQFPILLMKS